MAWLAASIAFFAASQPILSSLGLSFPSKYASITRTFILATLSLWASQAVIFIPRLILWILADLAGLTGTTYDDYYAISKTVHTISIWALGIVTAATTYLTQWLS